ncbi:S-layer homology domain-containing protein [Paenibacillus sp. 7541]|uniref:S-layer homology domain-containing protein n=1 Tax=Paenibacillus sp. 7541 TaxID=2026236 RepID=UPI000BA632FA|nr:S-layer homology domain-containing protein [Paenibacillus sp. 7541]PAK55220.1 S-layer protein [Paenibacillus sp. 7541]
MNRMLRKQLSRLLCLTLLISMLLPAAPAVYGDSASLSELPGGASEEPVTFVPEGGGQPLQLTDINAAGDALAGKPDYLALYTSGSGVTNAVYREAVWVPSQHIAVAVDASGSVVSVTGPDADPPFVWDPDTQLPIPAGGYVVLAGGSWEQSAYQQQLFQHFKPGDQVKLMRGGTVVTAADFIPQQPDPGPQPDPDPDPGTVGPELHLITHNDTIVSVPAIEVAGFIANLPDDSSALSVTVDGEAANLSPEGVFRHVVYLEPGVRVIPVKLFESGHELATSHLTVVYEPLEDQDYIEVEAAPKDITIDIDGPRIQLNYVDRDVTGVPNIVALFTQDYGASVLIPQFNVAVQVDANNRVLQVINPSINGNPPVWTGPTELAIPEGGYVLMAQDDSYTGHYIKRFLAENFRAGDVIKLRKNGEVVQVRDLMSGNGLIARLSLHNEPMYTVTEGSTVISGKIDNMDDIDAIQLLIDETEVSFEADGSFSYTYPLASGTNYIEVKVLKNDIEQDVRYVAVFARPGFSSNKEVILWVDQAANVRKFQSSEDVRQFLQKAKDTGITSVVLDVKGVEGYVSYKKNDLTGRPYVSEIQAPEKAGASPNLDLLQEFIDHGHPLGLEIHAAINVFAEGSIAHHEYAVLNDHLDWEERVYFPENNGEIKRLRESARQGLVAFVNPSHDEVREYQLKTFEEIIKNYDVDGVVHDRGRYDNEGADFSDVTRAKFEQFLQQRGKQLENWPEDIFYYENNARVDGPLIQEWWEFRSGTIQSFFAEVKSLVDSYEAREGREIKVSSYVGSWYETYYLNGVNWGSKNFRYHPALNMPEESVYTPEYYDTGYIEYLDFLMIGAYQTTSREIQKYITLGNIVTNGEIPLYAGIAMNNVQVPAVQREVFQAGLSSTNGLMLFDASQVNWTVVQASLENREWVKDFQLGMSLPGHPDSFMEGHFYNVNRVEGNVNVMTEDFGYSTGTNRFGVEVVVDDTGTVTRVVNKNQAIRWSWGAPEENNSVIPQGGFVISALDPSGIRTLRQLVANAYSVGDQVRSAALSGLLDDEGRETRESQIQLEGQVEVLGPGQAAVKVNGADAALSANGGFTAAIPLATGSNSVTVDVYVDGYKTNSKTFDIIRTSTGDGGSSPGSPGVPVAGSDGGTGSAPQPEPARPERLTISSGTDEDGRTAIHVEVNELRLLEDIERLSKLSPAAQVLAYSLAGTAAEGDMLTMDLPAEGLRNAVNRLPDGAVAIESSLGRFELPLAALKPLMTNTGQAEHLHIRIGTASREQEQRARTLLGDLLAFESSYEIALHWKQEGEIGAAVELPSGMFATFSRTLDRVVHASTTTVLRSHPSSDQAVFVPALFHTVDGKSRVLLRVMKNGVFTLVSNEKTFGDMTEHWAREDVTLLASKKLIEGLGESRFGPNEPVTRAQFTAMIVRALGLESQPGQSGFLDVQAGDWYADPVKTAVEHGLIEGFSSGEFRPNDRITREQMSVLLLRAMELAGTRVELGNKDALLGSFSDRDRLGGWSEEAVAVMVQTGLMNGRSGQLFAPKADSTRAEAAAVLTRMLQMAEYLNRSHGR